LTLFLSEKTNNQWFTIELVVKSRSLKARLTKFLSKSDKIALLHAIWLGHAKINEGPIFRRLIGRDEIGDALHPGSLAPIFKRVAQWIGMPARFVDEVSGHSTRVGAAQDLAELDIDLAAITQAGGWKSTRMPLQYAEKINAARSGMARAAAVTGRDQALSDEIQIKI
jgi:hypothetical protein